MLGLVLGIKGLSIIRIYAQTIPSFELITLEEGISNGFITAISQDKKGMMWFGTANGWNRFDGYEFRTFYPKKKSSATLNFSTIWAIQADPQTGLWLGTETGLFHFEASTEKFVQYLHQADQPNSLSHNMVESLALDRKGRLWVGTKHGLNILEPESKSFRRYFAPPEPTLPQTVKALLCDRQGSMWVGNLDTLYQYAGSDRFQAHALPPAPHEDRAVNFIRHLYEDRLGRLWIGTEGNGVFVFDKRERKILAHFAPHRPMPYTLSHATVTAVLEDGSGNIWIATYGGGLNLIEETTQELRHIPVLVPKGSEVKIIRSLFKDKAGNIWLGTAYEGLYLVKKHKKQFRNYTAENSGLRKGMGCYFAEGEGGKIWIGTQGGGLHLFDPKTETFSHFQHDPDDPYSLPNNTIITFSKDSLGDLWLVLDRYHLAHFDTRLRRFHSITLEKDAWLKLPHIDARNRVWIGQMDGLSLYDPQSQKLISYPLKQDPAYGDNRNVEHFLQTREGYLWISTHGGVNRYDPQSDSLHYFPCPVPVYFLYESQLGTFWAGTRSGLAIFDRESGQFQFLDQPPGLPDLPFLIQEDRSHRLWLSATKGLYCFDPLRNSIRHYDQDDGLINNQLLPGSLQTQSGEIFLSGISGFSRFHPDSIRLNAYAPPVVITDLSIEYKPIPIANSIGDTLDWPSPLQRSISYITQLKLDHWQNDLSFDFTTPDFTAPDNNVYQYRLKGYDESWITTQADLRRGHYTNLSPGEYVFEVKGANSDGIWQASATAVNILIHPPWWRSTWAYLLWTGIGFLLLFTVYRFQLNRRLAETEARRLQELDSIKSRLYTNITHEFRTPLTLILGLVGKLEKEVRQQSRESLNLVKRNGQQLLKLVNQMLDLSKLESGQLTLELEQGDIINYLNYLLESFHSYAESKQIRLHFQSEWEDFYLDYDPNRLMHIFSNLLSNAIKFSPAGSDVFLMVSKPSNPKLNDQFLQIIVEDTGIGIAPEQLPYIFDRFYQGDDSPTRKGEGTGIGLTLTKELLTLMGGSISVKSQGGQGSLFTLLLPIKREQSIQTTLPGLDPVPGVLPPLNVVNSVQQEDSDKPMVLIVEDHPDLAKYLFDSLQPTYRLRLASDGQQGIDQALTIIPDLILTDVMMPEKDGFALCEALKNHELTSHIPIIMLTAKADVQSRLAGLKRGADAYLAKPFHLEELQVRIEGLLAQQKRLQAFFLAQAGIRESEPTLSHADRALTQWEQQFLDKVNKVMEENLDNPEFGVELLSQAVNMSSSNLFRKMKALTGLNPNQYIRSFRLSKAKVLLIHSGNSVSEVAYQTGFSDPRYFSKAFKKEVGMTPSAFKNRK